MEFTLSPNIAIELPQFHEAAAMYASMLGVEAKQIDDHSIEIKQAGRFLYFDQHESLRIVMEFFVTDLEAARDELLGNGWTVEEWQGRGGRCYMKDPNGLYFNLWEVTQ
jgi:hypothetical protein